MSVYKRTRHSFEENIIAVLNDCRTPRTKHYIKDKYGFNNDKLRRIMMFLMSVDQVTGIPLIEVGHVKRDGRGTQSIQITQSGRDYLTSKGVKY